jgi:2-methylcitrate dehydratase PrpD
MVSDYEAGLSDRRLFELENRTTIELDEEVEVMSNERSTAARVGARLRDGRAFSVLVPAPKGSPSRPFSAEEHEARFAQELSSRISHQRCADIVAIAKDLDRLDASRLCGKKPAGRTSRGSFRSTPATRGNSPSGCCIPSTVAS